MKKAKGATKSKLQQRLEDLESSAKRHRNSVESYQRRLDEALREITAVKDIIANGAKYSLFVKVQAARYDYDDYLSPLYDAFGITIADMDVKLSQVEVNTGGSEIDVIYVVLVFSNEADLDRARRILEVGLNEVTLREWPDDGETFVFDPPVDPPVDNSDKVEDDDGDSEDEDDIEDEDDE